MKVEKFHSKFQLIFSWGKDVDNFSWASFVCYVITESTDVMTESCVIWGPALRCACYTRYTRQPIGER